MRFSDGYRQGVTNPAYETRGELSDTNYLAAFPHYRHVKVHCQHAFEPLTPVDNAWSGSANREQLLDTGLPTRQ